LKTAGGSAGHIARICQHFRRRSGTGLEDPRDVTFLIFLTIVALIAYRTVPRETLAQLPRGVLAYAAAFRKNRRAETAPFYEALAARSKWLVATPAIAVVAALTYVLVPAKSLVSIGPLTTNGEWWRLVTAMFTHGGLFLLLVNVAALAQTGRVVERLVGRFALIAAFTASGVLAGLMTISSHPLQPAFGASSAVAGLYGMLLVVFVTGRLHRSDVTIPPAVLKQAAPIALVFVIANLVDHGSNVMADLVGFIVGVAVGVFVARDVSEQQPSSREVAMALGGAFMIAIAAAIPLRGILDVKPELEKVVALERGTAKTYADGAARQRAGALTADGLAKLIAASIVPALRAEDEHLASLKHVPRENEASVADARHYLSLRIDSWTLRIQSLREPAGPPDQVRVTDGDQAAAFRARAQARHRASGLSRGRAEAAEREALDAFARIAPAS
jgi:rhomboid protease GluP